MNDFDPKTFTETFAVFTPPCPVSHPSYQTQRANSFAPPCAVLTPLSCVPLRGPTRLPRPRGPPTLGGKCPLWRHWWVCFMHHCFTLVVAHPPVSQFPFHNTLALVTLNRVTHVTHVTHVRQNAGSPARVQQDLSLQRPLLGSNTNLNQVSCFNGGTALLLPCPPLPLTAPSTPHCALRFIGYPVIVAHSLLPLPTAVSSLLTSC